MEFNIKEGMTDKELIKEMMGRTSGESSQVVSEVLRAPQPNIVKTTRNPADLRFNTMSDLIRQKSIEAESINKYYPNNRTLTVTKTNKEYGILRTIDIVKSGDRTSRTINYYLIGINDDDKYFVHLLQEQQCRELAEARKLESLIDYCNRIDQGFSTRVQGDMVMQFVPFKRKGGYYDFSVANEEMRVYCSEYIENVFGRHHITTDGVINTFEARISESNTEQMLYIVGTEFMIHHPEHKVVTYAIPEERMAVLAFQRGPVTQRGD